MAKSKMICLSITLALLLTIPVLLLPASVGARIPSLTTVTSRLFTTTARIESSLSQPNTQNNTSIFSKGEVSNTNVSLIESENFYMMGRLISSGGTGATAISSTRYKMYGSVGQPSHTPIISSEQYIARLGYWNTIFGSKAAWTVIVYLNGDNDLDYSTGDVFNGMEAGVCNNSNVNVVALWDRSPGHSWDDGTRRYKIKCDTGPYFEGVDTWDDGELNLGDAQTLRWFVSWAQAKYPADHYWLSIIDHGGGWSPELSPDIRANSWYSGGAGLSWDYTGEDDAPDYLSTHEMGEALRSLSNEGADPVDVVFYDAHLMGMLEEAYEIKDYARYFVASENVAWNTLPYTSYVSSIATDTQPIELAEHIVNTYSDTLSAPGTMSAMDLSAVDEVGTAVDDLAQAIIAEQYNATIRDQISEAYMMAQKLDYVGDDDIEQYREGYVDLYDLTVRIKQQVIDSVAIQEAAQRVIDTLDTSGFMITEIHPNDMDTHGVSIYMPFGEELYIGSGCDKTVLDICVVNDDPDCVKLRDYYTTTVPPLTQQLSFAQDTNWDEFVNSFLDEYYCSGSSKNASALRLIKVDAQGLPVIRPIRILDEPREPLFAFRQPTVGGFTISSSRGQGVYLPTILRGH